MKKKVRFRKGAILLEFALSIGINVMIMLGGLEWGWYLYVRQGLSGAAGQAVHRTTAKHAKLAVDIYLAGLNFSDTFIESVTVDFSKEIDPGPNKTTIYRVTTSLPKEKALLFGGTPSGLALSNLTSVNASAYYPDIKNN